MIHIFKSLILLLILTSLIYKSYAVEYDVPGISGGIIYDLQSDEILWSKNHNEKFMPASLSKLMVLFVLYEYLDKGFVTKTDKFIISEKAWKMGGSRMFVEPGKQVSVEDLIYGLIVSSGNDAAIVLAEGLASTEESFVDMMNQYAKELGMHNSHFQNASGWPHKQHYTTLYDMITLAKALINQFPENYHYFSETTYVYNNIKQGNRNTLLRSVQGSDGLKTGYASSSGYSLLASANREGRRVLIGFYGAKSKISRHEIGSRLLNTAFSNWSNYSFPPSVSPIARAWVWGGRGKKEVGLVVQQPKIFSFSAEELRKSDNISIRANYRLPLLPPLKKGEKVGSLRIQIPDRQAINLPLVVDSDIKSGGIISRLRSGLEYLVYGRPPVLLGY